MLGGLDAEYRRAGDRSAVNPEKRNRFREMAGLALARLDD
jgi:hypothetical protein